MPSVIALELQPATVSKAVVGTPTQNPTSGVWTVRYRITVENGQVVKAEGLDDPARRTVDDSPPDTIPTLAQLVTEVNEARRTRAGVAELETDPATGHPARITIDPEPDAIDDESCYAISGLTTP
jgi:hypothetical protein